MAKAFTNPSFSSDLPSANERFLSKVLVHALKDGFRTPKDFLRHFPPTALMSALDITRDLRARILAGTAGVHEKIAIKKSTAAAAEDLQLALDESVTEAATVLDLFPPDDRIRYLDAQALWNFVIEDEFWTATDADPARHRRCAGRLTFMLEQALEEKLINLQDLSDGISFEEIARRLPEAELRKIVKHALAGSRTGATLDEESLLQAVPLSELIAFIPLEHTWQRVVIAKIARPAGFLADEETQSSGWENAPPEEPANPHTAPTTKPEKKKASRQKQDSVPPIEEDVEIEDLTRDMAAEVEAIEIPESDRPLEEEARRRVTQRLMMLDRLPPTHASLSLPILLSIESMYADLLTLQNDEEREACIRESFPNESHLRSAMLGLIELLDPSVNTKDPVISEADVDSLMKVVLFEERKRYEQAKASGHSEAGSPTAAVRRGSMPSGAARRSTTPPPLPQSASTVSDSDEEKRAR